MHRKKKYRKTGSVSHAHGLVVVDTGSAVCSEAAISIYLGIEYGASRLSGLILDPVLTARAQNTRNTCHSLKEPI